MSLTDRLNRGADRLQRRADRMQAWTLEQHRVGLARAMGLDPETTVVVVIGGGDVRRLEAPQHKLAGPRELGHLQSDPPAQHAAASHDEERPDGEPRS